MVTCEEIEPGADLAAASTRALSTRARAAGSAPRLIDRRTRQLAPGATEWVLLHGEADGLAVTVEEWRLLAGGRLVTLSAACATAAYDRCAEAFGELAASLRVDPSRRGTRASEPRFDPGAGLLIVSDAGFEALRALAAGQEPTPEAARQLDLLANAGAVVDGEPHPALARSLATVVVSRLTLSLARRAAETTRAWADATGATMLVPAGDRGFRRLVRVRADLLPDALAGLTGLRPRPADPARETITLPAPALVRLIAGGPEPATAVALPHEANANHRAALAEIADHWRIEAHRAGAEWGEMLEVLDTGSGLWLVVERAGQVELRPADPAAVWRHLSQFTP